MDSSTNIIPLTSARHTLLPSSRIQYIQQHPVTMTAKLHSSEQLIHPVWTRLTSTPWEAKGKLLGGGYGVPLHRTMISIDAPKEFFNPHKTYHFDPSIKQESFSQTLTRGSKVKVQNEAAYVLPGGESVLKATIKSQENLHQKKDFQLYPEGKRMYLRNIATSRAPLPPIDWNSASARQRFIKED